MTEAPRSRLRQLAWESLVIFVGVAVALAADDLRETMSESDEVTRSLEIVLADLRRDSSEIAMTLEDATAHAEAAAWFFGKWGGVEPDRDSVEAALHVFRSFPRPAFSRAGYEGLLSGNRLRLLRDDDLRQLLFQYYQVDQPQADEYWEVLWERREGMLARLAPHIAWRTPPGADPSSLALLAGWDVLASDPALHTDIWRHGNSVVFAADGLGTLQVSVNSLLRAVRGS